MPNGYLAKNAVSFGHSWILEEAPCRGGRQIALSSQHLIHQEIRWGLVITVAHHLSFEPSLYVAHLASHTLVTCPGNPKRDQYYQLAAVILALSVAILSLNNGGNGVIL